MVKMVVGSLRQIEITKGNKWSGIRLVTRSSRCRIPRPLHLRNPTPGPYSYFHSGLGPYTSVEVGRISERLSFTGRPFVGRVDVTLR